MTYTLSVSSGTLNPSIPYHTINPYVCPTQSNQILRGSRTLLVVQVPASLTAVFR